MSKVTERLLLCGVLFLLIFSVSGCVTAPQWPQTVTLDRPVTTVRQDATVVTEDTGPDVEEIQLPGSGRKKTSQRRPLDPQRIGVTDAPVSLNVLDMPLSDFVIHALGETLKVAFVMDDAMMKNKTPITFQMPQPMPANKVLHMILGVLEKQGVFLEERDGALYIYQDSADASLDIRVGKTAVDGAGEKLQIVPLQHVQAEDVVPLITDLYSSTIKIKPYKKDNVLLLYGRSNQIAAALDFIATFDVPYLCNKKLLLLHVTYWDTEEFIAQITRIMENIGFEIAKKSSDPGLMFMPIKQLGSILAITPDDASADAILLWKKKLDTPEAAGSEYKTYTYIPKYSRASDLLESIHNLYQTVSSDEMNATQTRAGDTSKSRTAQKSKQTSARKTDAMTLGEEVKETSFEAPGLRVAADDRKNMLLILSKPTVYSNVLNLLRTLDVPVRQVLIEATIVELTLTDELKLGVEWYINNSQSGGSYTLGTLGNLGVSSTAGLAYSFLSDSGHFEAAISALAAADKANILSTPRLVVLDNTEADIQVGSDVPIVTGEVSSVDSSSDTSTSVYNSIEYRSTGVLLRVKPTINTDGLLTLDITQEVSDISETSGVSDSPIILTRKINTSIIAAHGQTIVLGGLMRENITHTDNKVPILGDIPVLGNLFKYSGKTNEKTELLVLVTPTILTNPDDAAKVSEQLRKELDWIE